MAPSRVSQVSALSNQATKHSLLCHSRARATVLYALTGHVHRSEEDTFAQEQTHKSLPANTGPPRFEQELPECPFHQAHS
mmetsp:Transcript_15232/g.41247  ORF Transcript_15232/g.41247 Transcript_15232/m.41247 type:complete len:80 (-) Transcript_15232:2593-2832(-)|eukprot:1137595-Pelagomonas_calceolata.AAC.6